MYKAGLVLEGGGMKGIFTAGVLDFFMEKEIFFSDIIGVSAGACQMVNYLSRQKGRGRAVMTDYLKDKRYMGLYSFITTGDVFGVKMNYDLVPNVYNPIDYDAYRSYEGDAYAVVTDIESGEAVYKKVEDLKTQTDYIRASGSLPLLSRTVSIEGHKYLDGGISDSIPIRFSESLGNKKNVVIMTKPENYRREREAFLSLVKVRYRKYPKMCALMSERHTYYNKTLDYIYESRDKGNLFLIQPSGNLKVGRLERDKDVLLALYEEGRKIASEAYDGLMKYLNKD